MSYLESLRVFTRVVELGSITSGGRDLRLTPAVAKLLQIAVSFMKLWVRYQGSQIVTHRVPILAVFEMRPLENSEIRPMSA